MKSKSDTKYRQIAQELLQEIREGMSPGDKLPPEVQLAERFGVHFMTIREALKVLQEGGVIQRQRAIGTQVINPFGGNWVSILCEMNVFSPHSHSLFHRSVIYHLRRYLREHKIPSRVSIGETEPGSEAETNLTSLDFVSDVEANRLAGVIALSVNPSNDWVQRLEKQGVPTIGSNSHFPYWVSIDNAGDTNRAIRTLVDYGRKRIAYMGWVHQAQDGELPGHLNELLQCYPDYLRRHWLKFDIHPETPHAGGTEFREIWTSDKEKPNGLIVFDEHLMPDVERVIKEQKIRVPEDLLIIRHRTLGNTIPCSVPTIVMDTDPQMYAFRMADMFLRLYTGKKLPKGQQSISRMFIDDEIRRHPSSISHCLDSNSLGA